MIRKLKLLLLSLLISPLLVCFWNCDLVRTSWTYNWTSITFNSDWFVCLPIVYDNWQQHYCMAWPDYCKYGFWFPSTSPDKTYKEFTFNYWQDWNWYWDLDFNSICSFVKSWVSYQLHYPEWTNNFTYYFYSAQNDCSSVESQLSSCQSSVNSLSGSLATCQSDLTTCQGSSSNCSETESLLQSCNLDLQACLSWNISWNSWSTLYINEILHEWAPIINIDIPEEISWDYTWTVNSFDIDIKGYNVDTEYISDIITNQKTPANSIDLNNIVQVLLPLFVPWLVIILFIYFAFKFIKKIF